jgi:hypothetical protein
MSKIAILIRFIIHSFNCQVQNATIPCRSQQLLPFLSVTFPYLSSPPTFLSFSLTSSYPLFLGLPLGLIDSKFTQNTLLGILFSSVLCKYSNQRYICRLIVSEGLLFITTFLRTFFYSNNLRRSLLLISITVTLCHPQSCLSVSGNTFQGISLLREAADNTMHDLPLHFVCPDLLVAVCETFCGIRK